MAGVDFGTGIFGGQADDDIAQFAGVAGESVAIPCVQSGGIELERSALRLRGVEVPEMFQ